MIRIENLGVYNFENAIRGARNPLESWDKSDSLVIKETNEFILGIKDKELALKLIKAGTDHSKFMRQIFVSMDITAPMTWWWDMDTYKVATVRNSTSRMHKLGTRLLTVNDFSWREISDHKLQTLAHLNSLIKEYQDLKQSTEEQEIIKSKELWLEIIEDLPESYNFLSTWTGNYQVLRNIYHSRKNHKQQEFRDFCKYIETELPDNELITIEGDR